MPPDLVIFDCDGVLVDSEPITNRLLRDDLAARGLALTEAEIDATFVGGTMQRAGETAAALGAAIPPDWVEIISAEMYRRLAAGTPLILGVEAVMDRLDAARIPYCVGSNGSPQKMEITLGQHPALAGRLAGRLYSAHVHGGAKPDPGLFLAAARAMGVAPDRTAVVEDSPSGCRAARRAGMACFGYAAGRDGARLSAEGAEVFHDMGDLPARLGL